jgi:hypothetical protein
MKDKILIGSVLFIAVILSFLWRWYFDAESLKLLISTDKNEYNSDTTLKIVLKNNSLRSICLSSCYPYYLEKKNSKFEPFLYSVCGEQNLNQVCVNPRQSKYFETTLPSLQSGSYRLAIPACIGCQIEENFREDKKFYSNGFTIK